MFEYVFELFDIKVKRTGKEGPRIAFIFETIEDLEVEKELIELRGEQVKAIIAQAVEPDDKKNVVTIEQSFFVSEISCRRVKQIIKLRLVVERNWEKKLEKDAVQLRFDDCKVNMTPVETELDFEGENPEDYQE